MEQIKLKNVLVLMSTYNGERFIREQLDSILAQRGINVSLLIRDDGSSDSTIDIINEYQQRYRNIEIDCLVGTNVGFVKSFSRLIEEAVNRKKQPDFFALADQDDIWFPEKILTACGYLSKLNLQKPCLFQSNSIMIKNNEELGLFVNGNSPVIKRGSAVIHATTQGCSMVFNKKAAELYNSNPPLVSWHDRWLFLICYYLGDTTYCHKPLFYYRIHESNALANNKLNMWRYFIYQMKSFAKQPLHLEMAKEFLLKFNDSINSYDKKLIRTYLTHRWNVFSKYKILTRSDFLYPFEHHRAKFIWKIILGRA